jgi:hypothetical protein
MDIGERGVPAAMQSMGTPADQENAPTTGYSAQAKIVGVTMHTSRPAQTTIAYRHGKVTDTIKRLRLLDRAPTDMKITLANALLFPALEYGL